MNKIIKLFIFFASIICYSQQTDVVDFKTAKAVISFDTIQKEVMGTVTYDFHILKDIDSIYLDAQNFKSVSYRLDHSYNDSLYNGNQIIVKQAFKKNTNHRLIVHWKTEPKQALYFIDWDDPGGNKQIWTQGQGKYTSNWLPSLDDMNDKIVFDLTISFNKKYQVMANGKLFSKISNDSITTWHYGMRKPMASYLVALAIGKYDKQETSSNSGIPIEMYYYPEDALKFEPTYRYTKEIFDYLEQEIGIPYPWQNYKEVPVKDFLYAGMENTSLTIFSDRFVVDSIGYNDQNFVNVGAHELAHQWFGDLVTETSGTHHWLQEGFATYYALLAERHIFGKNYYYWRLYEYADTLFKQDKSGGGTSLLDPKSSSDTFYKRGAWVLHALREKVGDSVFKTAVRNYLNDFKFKNVQTDDFLGEVEKVGQIDLKDFKAKWITPTSFDYHDAMESLKKSTYINEYLMADCEVINSRCKDYLSSGISDEAKINIISELKDNISEDAFKNALEVRKAIAQNVSKIPLDFKNDYESLLEDNSYETIEAALFHLWQNFPEDRSKYLNETKEIQGFKTKNVRLLWLTLALITEDYNTEEKPTYYRELLDYTSPKYGFEIRQNAIQYLYQIGGCNSECKENIEQATHHHNWQFSKFAKQLLKTMNQ
ncbi:M1 family metallopeptidase [Gaetbulibacter aestuarii]|uniref:Aminopeptidase N n=1 Tax=Gaetbulibacter aestuarii TaxID=1502358 RepID=A0ABW7MZF4_9FLAO